jgi:O-antigen/teichoic acid export membrane protein
MSLKQKTVSGLFWSFVDNSAKLGITFVVNIILARLLTPREFGLIGLTTVFVAVSQSIIDSGFKQALIRKQNCTQVDFSTVFYFNLLVSVGLYLLLSLGSGLIARFFAEPQLAAIIPVLGLLLISNGLAIVQQAQLTKEINFKLQTRISIIAAFVSGAVGISMALAGYGVWSLVATTLSRSIVEGVLLWLWNGWRPALIFSSDSFKEMFSFGSKLMAGGLLNTIYQNIYVLIIGRYFSAAELGYYTRADEFKRFPSQNLSSIVQRVSYPVLSVIQDDIPKLLAAYRRLIKSTMLIAFVLMLGLAAVAEPVMLGLLGEQWRPSIVYLQLLCLVGMFYPLHSLNLNMLTVQGRSDLFFRLEVIKRLLAIPTIIVGIVFGVKAMILGMMVNTLIAYFLNSYWSGKFIGYASWQQIRDVLPSFVLAVSVALIVYLAGYFMQMPYLYELIAQVALGALLTVGFAELSHLDSYTYIKLIVLDRSARKVFTT